MPIGAIIGAVGAVGAAGIGAAASLSAADKQASAAKKGRKAQEKMYEQARTDLEPYRVTGEGALYSLAELYGLPSKENPEGGTPFGSTAIAAFEASPDYAFARDQGIKAVDRSAAARGNLLSGGHLKDLTEYGQGLATQNFSNYYNRLRSLASLGENAAAGSAEAALSTGRGINQSFLAQGEAQASGLVGASNALTSGFNNAFNNLATGNALAGLSSPSSYGGATGAPINLLAAQPAPATMGGLY